MAPSVKDKSQPAACAHSFASMWEASHGWTLAPLTIKIVTTTTMQATQRRTLTKKSLLKLPLEKRL